jgi:transposase-like protein
METLNICSLAPYCTDEAAAWELLESLRWPEGNPECPHCGEMGNATLLKPRSGQATTSTGRVSYRRTWKCRNKTCRRKFSVLVGSIFEDSKVPISKWLMAFHLLTASKNGVAAYELHRTLGVTNKTAWFMFHRIREAMKEGPLADMLRGTVIADETFVGPNPGKMNAKSRRMYDAIHDADSGNEKVPVLSLINATTGEVRSRVIPDVTGHTLRKVMAEQIDMAGSVLHTDEWQSYKAIGKEFISHGTVNHKAAQWVHDGASTNKAENYFSQLKRSLDGTHHHVSREHLQRYITEHDFRYSTRDISDSERMRRLVSQTGGRRLTYKRVKTRHPTTGAA